MSTPTQPVPQSGQPAAGYFVDSKKGEVNELKQLLKNINVERDVKKKREIIKKVIAYMTLGIDVSRLFSDMIMAIETKDLVVKKMVYLYLCNYAHKQPDMAIMCINSLRRDCDNEDPMVRGLALRSICNLRLESILEYIDKPLQKSLTDLSSYVRKTGVMGILKVNQLSPAMIENNDYVSQLYRMLQDADANVVTNVIVVLNELLIAQGGMEVSQSTVMSLLNRIGEFSEWGLNTVLDLVSRYNPATEDETFAIMNLLDPVLRTANSGAVLATFKCFVKLTENFPELQPQIYSRAKPPMLTLITGANPEVQYSMLRHLGIILPKKAVKGIFDDEFRQFFVRYNEPAYVKHLKVELLPLLCNDVNARDVAVELAEYVTDVDVELSRRAIDAIGQIAMRVASVAPELTQSLLDLVDLDISYVRSQAVKNLSSIIRIFPDVRVHMLPMISKCLRRVDDEDARAALIWMLGEYGEEIVEAPYLLEPVVDNYPEEQSALVKLHLMTTAMKLFFKRPPEMHAILGRLLNFGVNDSDNQDVHDRALLYYRLLSTDVTVAASLFQGLSKQVEKNELGLFAEDRDDETRNRIFKEFNTLAVIYGKPSADFIAEEYQWKYDNAPIRDDMFQVPSSNGLVSAPAAAPATTSGSTVAAPVGDVFNLLDFGNDVAIVPPAPSPIVTHTAALSLRHDAEMPPARFQSLWGSLPEAFGGRICGLGRMPGTTSELEQATRKVGIFTIASGPLNASGGGFKFFLYGLENDDLLTGTSGAVYLLQLTVDSQTRQVNGTLKTTSDHPTNATNRFMELLVSSIAIFSPN